MTQKNKGKSPWNANGCSQALGFTIDTLRKYMPIFFLYLFCHCYGHKVKNSVLNTWKIEHWHISIHFLIFFPKFPRFEIILKVCKPRHASPQCI